MKEFYSKDNFNVIIVLLFILLTLLPVHSKNTSITHDSKISPSDSFEIYRLINHTIYQQLDQAISKHCIIKGFNGVIMIVFHNRPIYNKAFGFYNTNSSKQAIKTTQSFQLASVSKQFTAAAIMKLKQEHRLEYDDFVCDYINNFPYNNITIRQLLNHTGGLFNYMNLLEEFWTQNYLPNNNTLMSIISSQNIPLFFTPGKFFDYSNTGYAILAAIIENITNMPFPEYMNLNFFKPLNMKDTYVFTGTNLNPKSIPGYYRFRSKLSAAEITIHDGITGDKGVYTTTTDMFLWNKSLNENTILSEPILKEAFSPALINSKYGFGFRTMVVNNDTIVYHNGKWEGFRINYYRLPHNSAILVMNNSESNIHSITKTIYNLLDELHFDNTETFFFVDNILNNNLKNAKYIYLMETFENKFDHKSIDSLKQFLWQKKYYEYYETLTCLAPNIIQ